MKSLLIIVIAFVITVINAVPVEVTESDTSVIENKFEDLGEGNYKYKYETSDGAVREETGEIKHSYLTVRGSYEFIGEDGEKYVINYVADEKGFRPVGDHLP